MFIYNLKFSQKAISKIFVIISLLIILLILGISIYIIFFRNNSNGTKSSNLINLDETNYANILKSANEDIDSYVGKKVHVTGYIYRLLDFDKNQFVIARDMRFDESSQPLVVGFLACYDKASDFSDGDWVEITGEIVKGNFNGEIAMLKVISIKKTDRPQNIFVSPPDYTYIPTSYMF